MNLKQLFAAMLLLVANAAGAQSTESKKTAIKKMDVQRFHRLVVDASIDVLLIEDDEPGKLYIEGDSAYFAEITLTEKEGVLTISGLKDRNYKKRIFIGLPVQQLKEVEVNAEGFVLGMNTLQSDDLSVILNQRGKVSLKTTGSIKVAKL
jgi:hypothetical protein